MPQSKELLTFNVFTDQYRPDPKPIFNGVRSSVRRLYESDDGKVLVTSRKYPDGAEYDWGMDCRHDEVFYVVEGTVRCTPNDGEPVLFERGQVIYYPAGLEAHWEYSRNSQHVAIFWGDEPLRATASRDSDGSD